VVVVFGPINVQHEFEDDTRLFNVHT